MAKRRRAATRTTTKIVRVGSPAPIIRVATPRAAPVRRRRSSHGHSRGGHVGGLVPSSSVQAFVGGAVYGYAVKSGLVAKLPALPVIGRTGTAALLLAYWAKHGGGRHVHSAAIAAASIAGYQLGNEGSISGDFAMGHDATTPGSVNSDVDDGYGDPRQAPGES